MPAWPGLCLTTAQLGSTQKAWPYAHLWYVCGSVCVPVCGTVFVSVFDRPTIRQVVSCYICLFHPLSVCLSEWLFIHVISQNFRR